MGGMKYMRFLPKAFGQLIMLTGNIKPHYVIYSSDREVIIGWYTIKYLSIVSACGILLINIAVVPIMYYQRSLKKRINKCEHIIPNAPC
jgi:Flp pilus assembly protein TadB